MEQKLFTSVEEECLYWKERCLKVTQERDDAQREFDDFSAESRQLEAELEMQVEQQEKKIRDLNQLVNQLNSENESHKRKMQYTENETNRIDADFRLLAKENEKCKVYIRELEQKNDDLERANRVASESVVEFESMLNQAYEKNALLELEVDEKERMQIKLQRLMDEARDLKQELKVRNLKTDENGEKLENDDAGANSVTTSDVIGAAVSSGTGKQVTNVCLGGTATTLEGGGTIVGSKLETLNNNLNMKQRGSTASPLLKFTADKLSMDGCTADPVDKPLDDMGPDGPKGLLPSPTTATATTSPLIIDNRNGNNSSSTALVPSVVGLGSTLNPPMAPSDRVSTLNIVADLLRRLDNMEAKLKAWKIRKPSSRTSTTGSQRGLHNSHVGGKVETAGGLMEPHRHPHHSHHSLHHYQNHHHIGGNNGGAGMVTSAESNHSLSSIGSTGSGPEGSLLANCCSTTTGGNVQLHSYQPSTITIGTQTSQNQSTLAAKSELLRTNK